MQSLKPLRPDRENAQSKPARLDAESDGYLACSEAEKTKWRALGLPPSETAPRGILRPPAGLKRQTLKKKAICAPEVLNEASDYGSPA